MLQALSQTRRGLERVSNVLKDITAFLTMSPPVNPSPVTMFVLEVTSVPQVSVVRHVTMRVVYHHGFIAQIFGIYFALGLRKQCGCYNPRHNTNPCHIFVSSKKKKTNASIKSTLPHVQTLVLYY